MNTVKIMDKASIPDFMVKVPKFKVSDVIPGGRDETHPAFIVNGQEVPAIYISKYQNVIIRGSAYSLPYQQPTTGVNFDEARQACEVKGKGWHLMSNAEWAAVALWAKAHGTLPHGNNNGGADFRDSSERGACFDGFKILTGTGPKSFSHDGTEDGIYDLNGNVWEWVSGLRLMNGEVQIIPDNDSANQAEQTEKSRFWKSIPVDGKPVRIAETDDGLEYTTEQKEAGWNGCDFADISSSIKIPSILKELALFPSDELKTGDYFGAGANGECLPLRGGAWWDGAYAGVFGLGLNDPRSGAYDYVGFRSAFVEI